MAILPVNPPVDSDPRTMNQGSPVAVEIAGLRESVTRQSTINLISGVVSQGLKFAVVIYIARHFSTAEFGMFSFAWAINACLVMISQFGLPTFGARQVACFGWAEQCLLGDIFRARFLLAVASVVTTVLLLLAVPHVSHTELWLVALFGLSNVGQAGFLDWVFQGLGRFEISGALNVTFQASWLVLVFLLVRAGEDIRATGLALCLASILITGLGFIWLQRVNEKPVSALFATWRGTWTALNSASGLGIGALLINLVVWSDAIWVRLLSGEVAVGIYAAGNRAALALSMLATFFVQGAFPLLSRTRLESQSAFEHCLQRTVADLAGLYVPGSLWSIYYARTIIDLVFGPADYSAAVPIFRIFQIVLLLFVANAVLGMGVLAAAQRDKAFRNVLAGTAVIFLFLCPLLTLRWEIYGTAAAMLVSQGVSFLWFCYEARSLVSLNFVRTLTRPVVVGISVLAICQILRLSPLSGALVVVVAYLALLMERKGSQRFQTV